MHKGVLFSGKPGVGKTELARAMANEANCNFFYQSAAEFMDSIVGMGVVKIQKLFQKARETGPAIIFLDEIDSLAYDRRESTSQYAMNELNQILTEMDGFEKDSKIIVIAATNRPERLDKSIMRAGRFDKKIDIPLPDLKGRVQLLEHFSKKIKLAEKIDFKLLASRTTGMSGADIKNLVNIAVLHAILEKRNSTTQKDFEFAHDRMVMGVYRKNLVMEEHTKILTAYHEAGHTLMNLLTNPGMALHKVTILPVGQSLGHTAFSPMTEQNFFTEENLDCMLDVAMGGRIAEELVFGEKRLSTGCSQDLKQASQIANELVRNMGVSPNKSAPLHVSGEVKDMSETINEITDSKIETLLLVVFE